MTKKLPVVIDGEFMVKGEKPSPRKSRLGWWVIAALIGGQILLAQKTGPLGKAASDAQSAYTHLVLRE